MATKVVLDQTTIDKELRSRSGVPGRIMAGFAGLATKEIKSAMQSRAGGAYWQVSSSISGNIDPTLTINVQSTRPHLIVPRRSGGVLVFSVGGSTVFTRRVNHPGSSPPTDLINDAMTSAGQKFPSIAAGSATGV